MNRSLTYCSLAAFLLLLAAQAPIAEVVPANGLQQGVQAKLIKPIAPSYPESELSRGQQGWAQLSYCVTADGKIAKPVIEDSSGSEAFEKAALRAVENWRYEPATLNGEPVEQCQTNVKIAFAVEEEDDKTSGVVRVAFAQGQPAIGLQRGVKARPIDRAAPSFPKSELSRRQQGWAQLSYCVTIDGEIADPVIEDSSGSEAFEKAALRAVNNWSYEPATWNGEPVEQCRTNVMIAFAIEEDDTKVSRTFLRRYKKIDNVIDKGQLARGNDMVAELNDDLNLSLAETAWMWALKARLAGLAEDKKAQLIALRKATQNNGRWIDKKVYPKLLLASTALELQEGNLSRALVTYEKLEESGSTDAQLEKIRPHIQSVRQMVASEKALAVSARIGQQNDCVDCANNWHYQPLRRRFSIAEVSGELNNIELRCAWQRVVDKAIEGKAWELPEDWGDCAIVVFGAPGTVFKLLELPNA